MWRLSEADDESEIVAMSVALYEEDPAAMPVPPTHTCRTLNALRKEPGRGRAVVLEQDKTIAGYALLISFWSNELGGEVLVIDEFYVKPDHRGRGSGRELIQLLRAKNPFWPELPVALELEVTPGNQRAEKLYTSVGFSRVKNARMRLNCHPN